MNHCEKCDGIRRRRRRRLRLHLPPNNPDKNEMHFNRGIGRSGKWGEKKRASISGKLSFVQIPILCQKPHASLARSLARTHPTIYKMKLMDWKRNGPIWLCIDEHEHRDATDVNDHQSISSSSLTVKRVTSLFDCECDETNFFSLGHFDAIAFCTVSVLRGSKCSNKMESSNFVIDANENRFWNTTVNAVIVRTTIN